MNAILRRLMALLVGLGMLALPACGGGKGDSGPPGAAGPAGTPTAVAPSPTGLTQAQDLPGVVFAVTKVDGASGAGGAFQAGDVMAVTFTVKRKDGSSLPLTELTQGETHFSGPTFNYQRVLPRKTDLAAKSVQNADGSYTYNFDPIPAAYAAPVNDTGAFSTDVLKGQALLSGTYTLALIGYKNYTVGNETVKDVANTAYDVLFGTATTLEPREVVTQQNCNQCHVNINWHNRGLPGGGRRTSIKLCGTCHSAGAEDFSHTATAVEGLPKNTVEFKVLIHKIHNGAHLPSVLGVGVDAGGNRVYDQASKPMQSVSDEMEVHDWSDIGFPVWPNADFPMPRDLGYSALVGVGVNGRTYKTNDDTIRKGVTACEKCHGVPAPSTLGWAPDAAPKVVKYPAPKQGDFAYLQPSRRACGSCHDDVDWAKPYVKNGRTMPPQADDASCVTCHIASGTQTDAAKPPSTTDAHLHPLNNTTVNPGVRFELTAVDNGAGKDLTTTAAANGDKVRVTFAVTNAGGANISIGSLDSASALLVGPSTNQQIVFPYPSPNGDSINPFDFTGRLAAVSTTGKGSMSKAYGAQATETLTVPFTSATAFTVTGSASGALGASALPASPSTNPAGASISSWVLTPAAAEQTITVAFTSATDFTVTGSVSGAMGSGTLPAGTAASVRFVSTDGSVAFIVNVGAAAFAAGNNMYAVLFRGSAPNRVAFAIVAGKTGFAAGDRFYYEVINEAATPYTYFVPMDLALEYLGDGTGAAGQVLTAGNLPVYYGRQTLYETTAVTASGATLTAAAKTLDRSVDVTSTAAFGAVGGPAATTYAVIDSGGPLGTREYVQVGYIESATRVWFKTPLRYAHAGGAAMEKPTLTVRLDGIHYALNPAAGTVTSVAAFGAGNGIVMTYRTDGSFGWMRHTGDALQTVYAPPMNDSPDLDQTWGDWSGKTLVSGTYTVGLWGYQNLDVAANGEVQTYRSAAVASKKDILYGTATEIKPHLLISSAENCNACHSSVMFHGGSRWGFDTCVMCHSVSGAEDFAKYSNTAADPTPGITIDFRTMLHKIHRGADLANASTYGIVGFGPTTHFYDSVGFPVMREGVKNCEKCHGLADGGLPVQVYDVPSDRSHPTQQVAPLRQWRSVCASCHDASSVAGHMDLNTSAGGQEACGTCHGSAGATYFTGTMHKNH